MLMCNLVEVLNRFKEVLLYFSGLKSLYERNIKALMKDQLKYVSGQGQ